MFAEAFGKWFDRLKAERDDARAVLDRAEDVADGHDHGHVHDHFDGVTHAHDHDHAHGDRDFDHRHDHT